MSETAIVMTDLLPEMTSGETIPSNFVTAMPDDDIAVIAEFLGIEQHHVKAVVWLAEAFVADEAFLSDNGKMEADRGA